MAEGYIDKTGSVFVGGLTSGDSITFTLPKDGIYLIFTGHIYLGQQIYMVTLRANYPNAGIISSIFCSSTTDRMTLTHNGLTITATATTECRINYLYLGHTI